MKHISVILTIFFSLNLFAQTNQLERDFMKFKNSIKFYESYSLKFNVEVRVDDKTNSLMDIEMLVKDSNSYTKIGQSILTINGTKTSITIDNDLKFMSVANRTYSEKLKKADFLVMPDTGCEILQLSTNGNFKSFKVTYFKGEFESALVDIDTLTGIISKVEYVHRNSTSIGNNNFSKISTIIRVVEYAEIVDFPDELFYEESYFYRQKRLLKPVELYKDYQMFDLVK